MQQSKLSKVVCLFILSFVGLDTFLSAEVVTQAIRTNSSPIIDGKLTDSCWQKANPITNFLLINTNRLAKYQTIAYIFYDDLNIYIGIKCLEENVSNIKAKIRKDDEINLFEDDVVEIMIAPESGKRKYFHFAINAVGSKVDLLHRLGGIDEYITWNGEWEAVSFIGENYWSCEVRIPYYTLGIISKSDTRWRINLCREKQNPLELSSIGKNGIFNDIEKFVQLNGINVDFNKYCFRIGEVKILGEIKDHKLFGKLVVPIKNEVESEIEVEIQKLRMGKTSTTSIESEKFIFSGNEEKHIQVELLEMKQTSSKDIKCEYSVLSEPEIKKIKILDLKNRQILAMSWIDTLDFYIPIKVVATNSSKPELEITLNFTEKELKEGKLSIEIIKEEKSEIFLKKTIVSPSATTKITFTDSEIPDDKFIARIVMENLENEIIAETNTEFVKYSNKTKRLNNLVIELLNIKIQTKIGSHNEYEFENPKDGWVFISITTNRKKKGKIFISIDSLQEGQEATIGSQVNESFEVMRLLSFGEHKIKLRSEIDGDIFIIVRSIPEILYYTFQPIPDKPGYTQYDWQFLQRYILKNINCMIGISDSYKPVIEAWKKDGRKWINSCGVPHMVSDIELEDTTYKLWTGGYFGFESHFVDGILVDEFFGDTKQKVFEGCTKAIERIYSNKEFSTKTISVFCSLTNGGIYIRTSGRRFADAIIAHNKYNKLVLELYLNEQPTETMVDELLNFKMREEMIKWEEAGYSPNKIIACLGYFNIPSRESLNVTPKVDWKVFMDKEFNFIANDTAFLGLYGVMEYLASFADEEAVRWASLLYRHYCIEGKKEMLSKKYGFKYNLDHIQNPDFDDGTEGWIIKPAESESMAIKKMEGLGKLQGRFHTAGEGDNFLWLKRSKERPNIFSQKIKNLIPGKLYSLKMLTGDYKYLSEWESELEKEKHAISINIDNVELIADKCFQEVSGDSFPGYKKKKTFINYYCKIFRAKGTDAELLISDWINNKEQRGPIGQELMCNFIELQPYLDDK